MNAAGIGVFGYSPAKTPVHTGNQSYTQTIVSSSGNFKPNWSNSKVGQSDRPLGKTYNKPFQDVVKTKRPSTPKGGPVKNAPWNSPSPVPRPTSARSKTPRHNNHNESYVDETLFGPKLASTSFKAPWDAKDPVIHNFDLTDYKNQNTSRETPRSSRPTSARSKNKYKSSQNHNSGEVDETLFGPGGSGKAPFEHSLQGSAVKIYSDPLSSRPGSARSGFGSARPGSRPGSARSNSQSRPSSAQKIKHSQSYVDETLFGPKPIEPDFTAPWDQNDKKPRPMFTDSSNYTVIIQHPPNTNRPRSTVKLRNVPNVLPDKKPVWR